MQVATGKRIFNNIALERIAKDDRQRFIYALLQAHQEILEEGGMAIDGDVIRLYCASEEEARALHDGR